MNEVDLVKEGEFQNIHALIEQRIQSHKEVIASDMVDLTKAEIFRRFVVEFETRLRYFVGEDRYYDEIISILGLAGHKLTRSQVAFNLSKASDDIGFIRKSKKFKYGCGK